MKKIIYIIPGIFADGTDYSISNPIATLSDFDVIIHEHSITATDDLGGLLGKVSFRLGELSGRYDSIFIITHSSGSELILRTTLPKNVRAAALWSPSMFYKQNVSASLPKKGDGMLIVDKRAISEKLARDLDALETRSVIHNMKIPCKIYLTKDDYQGPEWPNQSFVPYRHNYSREEWIEAVQKSAEWFKKI